VLPEVSAPASTPASRRPRTWSRIKAMRGEITTVTPSRMIAGSWKHSDLPPPVGMMASTFLPRRNGAHDLRLAGAEPVESEDGG
jgi:hypothetical protein